MRLRKHPEIKYVYFDICFLRRKSVLPTRSRLFLQLFFRRCHTLTRMNDILMRLGHLASIAPVSFGAFDPAPLFAGASFEFAPAVGEFFTTCIPSSTLDLELCRILSAAAIATENQDLIPSYFCAPHGFITISTDSDGDAFAVDVTTGKVFHLSHEKYETNGIHPGWNANFAAFLSTLPVTRENIINTSEGHWDSIADFLQEILD